MSHKDLNHIPVIKVELSEMGLEEVEGRFMERFNRLPDAEEALVFYTILTQECPMCGEKRLAPATEAYTHWIKEHGLDMPRIETLTHGIDRK